MSPLSFLTNFHPVAVDAEAFDKRVYTSGSLIVQRIHELSGGHPSVGQFHIINREFTIQF
jgi:hypothetical protein